MTGREFWNWAEAQHRVRVLSAEENRDVLMMGLSCLLCDLVALQMLFHFDARGRTSWMEHAQPQPFDLWERWTGRAQPERPGADGARRREQMVGHLNQLAVYDASVSDA